MVWKDPQLARPEAFPFSLPAVRRIDSLSFDQPVTFLIGENGSGKSTVLEAMAVLAGCNPEGGSQNFSFSTYASHAALHEALRLVRTVRRPRTRYFLRAESYYNVATQIERLDEEDVNAPKIINAYGGRSLHRQSHGESFMALLLHQFGPRGLYFLDEPEAALSPTRQLALLSRMKALVDEDSQFVIATHSPILMSFPGAVIYQFGADGAHEVAYEETEHFRVTRDFLNNVDRRLTELLRDDGSAPEH